jgi:integrase
MSGRTPVAPAHIVGQVRLRQRGPRKVWHARYMTPAGRKEESLKVTNLKVAVRKATELNSILDSGQFAALEARHQAKKLTFASFMAEFKANYSRWGPTTWAGNKSRLQRLEEEFGDIPLNGLTARHIESFLARKREHDGVTIATTNRYLTTLKTILKMAVRWGYLPTSPADSLKMLKEETQIPAALTEDQLACLLRELPDYAQTIVTFAVDTGLRRSEMAQLNWSDVSLDDRTIVVQGSSAKNDEFRVIPMTDRVHGLLCALHQQAPLGKGQTRVLPWKDIKIALKGAGKRSGVGHVHLHMLRHTFATRLRDRGVPLDRIKELLGHKSMAMVLRYAKARPEQLRDAIQALNT